jgi:hypothetical protein
MMQIVAQIGTLGLLFIALGMIAMMLHREWSRILSALDGMGADALPVVSVPRAANDDAKGLPVFGVAA